MNNYHLYLIRSTGVTLLAAHLVAGILALILFCGMSAPRSPQLSTAARSVHLARVTMPSVTALAAHELAGP